MNVRDIVTAYLKANGYDGLYREVDDCYGLYNEVDDDCGCALDDLAPCDYYNMNCRPGYKLQCDMGKHDCRGDCIGPRKEG